MPITREALWLRDHLEDAIGAGRAVEAEDLLEQEDILYIEEVLNDCMDDKARRLIEKRLSPTPYKERGIHL